MERVWLRRGERKDAINSGTLRIGDASGCIVSAFVMRSQSAKCSKRSLGASAGECPIEGRGGGSDKTEKLEEKVPFVRKGTVVYAINGFFLRGREGSVTLLFFPRHLRLLLAEDA